MAKKKSSRAPRFEGRVVQSDYDPLAAASEVLGPHFVAYPKSTEDVAAAVALSKNLKTFVRSGVNAAKGDAVDATGGVVINMLEMTDVKTNRQVVQAQPAATAESVADNLAQHKLALPLSDNSLKSIAANVLEDGPSYLMRSLGPLSEYVTEVEAVNPDGSVATMKHRAEASCAQQCRDTGAVITEVKFKASSAKDLWMFRVSFPYPGQEAFINVASNLLSKANLSALPPEADLALDALTGPYNIPLVRISGFGTTTKGENKLKKLVRDAVAPLSKLREFDAEDIVEESLSGPDVLEAIVESGMGPSPDETVESRRLDRSLAATGDLNDFLIRYANLVHQGLAYGRDATGKLTPEEQLSTSLRVNRDNGLELTGHVHTPTVEDSSALRLRARPLHEGAAARVPRALATGVPDSPIPNFRGDVFTPNQSGYKSRRKQYATSSYPAASMTPYMIAFPRDDRDIAAAIKFAGVKGKRVVARSGGHQYSGKSSGGPDTIVLGMDNLKRLDVAGGGLVDVGPGVRLDNIAKRFKSEGITIPHGECPHVCIGGHAQTGGFGHLVRSFGLCLDYVEGFDIVLADGTRRSVTRPGPSVTTTAANDELFWGVLGGNAGSFGIVSNYRFRCIKDNDHPNSYGFVARRRYKEVAFFKLMKEVQKWTRKIEAGTLEPGVDFMMTVASSRLVIPFPALLVELVHANLGGPSEAVDGNRTFKSIITAARHKAGIFNLFSERGQQSLSSLSQSFVRKFPEVTPDGREFKYPYKKRINCTMSKLSDEFIEQFVKKISHVVFDEPRVKLVFQMVMGGGAYQNSEHRADTSISHRDYVFCFVFDLFYKRRGKQAAERLQREMQQLIDAHFNHGQERRVFWGSFGDTDISKPKIRKMYYDSNEQYSRLQQLKKDVDPNDVFHTSLTVQLPDD